MYLDMTVGNRRWRAATRDTMSQDLAKYLADLLPLTVEACQDRWSKDLLRMTAPGLTSLDVPDEPLPFQQPGLLMVEPVTGDLALCYGEGRLQDGFGNLRPIPLAEIGGDLGELEIFGRRVQFTGAQKVTISASEDQMTPLQPSHPDGDRMRVTLGETSAEAVLLRQRSPVTVAAFAARLPLTGTATNTISSGPLTRFWYAQGGPEGNVELDVTAAEAVKRRGNDNDRDRRWGTILWPGFIYYKPEGPVRGLRMAFAEATVMKGILNGTASLMVPIAQLVGDWSAMRGCARSLTQRGQVDMALHPVDDPIAPQTP